MWGLFLMATTSGSRRWPEMDEEEDFSLEFENELQAREREDRLRWVCTIEGPLRKDTRAVNVKEDVVCAAWLEGHCERTDAECRELHKVRPRAGRGRTGAGRERVTAAIPLCSSLSPSCRSPTARTRWSGPSSARCFCKAFARWGRGARCSTCRAGTGAWPR